MDENRDVNMDRLGDLYRIKGEVQTQIELANSRLQSVNQEIVKILNERAKSGV